MTQPSAPNPVSLVFDEARAEAYDTQFAAMQPIKDAVHLLIEAHFAELPADAHILMAGAGTGAEARYLAARFPGWRFTLIDPSAAMLAVARRHAEAEDFAARCSFVADYVSATPPDAHDAATSLLVSHFLTEAPARQAFFADIAARLKPGGLLFNLDLCADRGAPGFAGTLDLWLNLLHIGGVPEENRKGWVAAYGRDFGVHGPSELEALIEAAGFTPPAPVFQAAMMRGWTAAKR
jgi:tRNA (cmo5U34)-methyltransferase